MFQPKRVFFEKQALDYGLGKELYDYFRKDNMEIKIIPSHNRVTGIPGKTSYQAYLEAKRTLVVGVKRGMEFQGCKPSAHYQLPLATSCPGKCQYCYLQTTLGKKPYVRIYVNLEEILDQAKKYMEERSPEITVFEGAATSDPIPVEPYSRNLEKTIRFFGREKLGRFRFVTKFTDVHNLLDVEHNGHTRFRFSLNTDHIISKFELGTPRAKARIEASAKVAEAGYPLGFIIAPVFIYQNWQRDYEAMLEALATGLKQLKSNDLTFEVITHRFTKRAKANILDLYPDSELPLNEEERKVKYGQFGYIKYVYNSDEYEQVTKFFEEKIAGFFPDAKLEYLV